VSTQTRIVATLGGPGTFAGQATRLLIAEALNPGGIRYDISYFATMDEVWDAMSAGVVDSGVLTSETTNYGLDEIAARLLGANRDLFVNAEILVPYRCMLLGKPGSATGDIRVVLGHGSLVHCRRYLAAHLPQAEVRMHEQNSLAAAAEVLAADGSVAVVGTIASARKNGLTILARDVDDAAVGAWWLVSRHCRVDPRAEVIAAAVDHSARESLVDVMIRARRSGLHLRSVTPVAAAGIFRHDVLVVFTVPEGTRVPSADALLNSLPGTRLVGAFRSTAADPLATGD